MNSKEAIVAYRGFLKCEEIKGDCRGCKHFADGVGCYFDKYKNDDAVIELVKLSLSALERSEWISVNDRLPEVNTAVLIYANKKVYTARRYICLSAEWWSVNNRGNTDMEPGTKVPSVKAKGITHWMPLPEPPEVQNAES